MAKKTQLDRIAEHFEKHGNISSQESFTLYGDTRLSDKVYQLRNRGWDIESVPESSFNRYGVKVDYVRYVYKKRPVVGATNLN